MDEIGALHEEILGLRSRVCDLEGANSTLEAKLKAQSALLLASQEAILGDISQLLPVSSRSQSNTPPADEEVRRARRMFYDAHRGDPNFVERLRRKLRSDGMRVSVVVIKGSHRIERDCIPAKIMRQETDELFDKLSSTERAVWVGRARNAIKGGCDDTSSVS
jgi:hypothetical protein